MPSTVNGIGTWYYGKSNVHRIKSQCEFCNSVCELTSYDTTLYFVVFFIPVIPLGKKRILDECAVCQKHRFTKVKDWEKAKTEAMTATLSALAEKPNDPDALSAALATATQFQDVELFERIAGYIQTETENPKLQQLLGETSGYFGRREQADAAFAHAIRNNPVPDVYKPAAMNALRMGEPERAAQLLDYITRDKVKEDFGYLQVVIDSLQGSGQHTDALALMDKRDAAFPELADDKNLIKARKQSEKYAGTNKKLNTVNLIETDRFGSAKDSGGGLAKWIFPILLVTGFLGYLGYSYYLGSHSPIHIVNGTNKAYTINVNGESTTVNAYQAKKIDLPEGKVTIDGAGFDPIEHTLESNFWSRAFTRPATLFNPDRVAVITEETSTYSKTPTQDPPPVVHMGQAVYTLPSPHYLFEPFPATISVKGNSTITKKRIGLIANLDSMQLISVAMNPKYGNQNNTDLLRHLANSNPNEILFVQILSSLIPPEEFDTFVKKGLGARPLRMEWHRLYQTKTEQTKPEYDLVTEYRKLNDELKNSESKYLLARVMPDGPDSLALMTEAAQSSPPSPHACFSMSYRTQANGQFDESVKWAKQANELSPNSIMFIDRYVESLWATGDYVTIREVTSPMKALIRRHPLLEQFRAAVAEKNREAMSTIRNQVQLSLMPNQEKTGLTSNNLDVAEALVKGDAKAFIEKAAKASDGENDSGLEALTIAFLQSKLDQAEKLLSGKNIQARPVAWYGVMSLAYRKAKNDAKADQWLAKSAEELAKQGRNERAIGQMLSGKSKLDAERVLQGMMQPDEKRIALRLFAQKFPEHATAFFALAQKLDVQRDEISLILKQLAK